jgi:hypothetical protein
MSEMGGYWVAWVGTGCVERSLTSCDPIIRNASVYGDERRVHRDPAAAVAGHLRHPIMREAVQPSSLSVVWEKWPKV